ncbi:protein TonB [Luteibacter sp. Sphag1AF]|uniref:energy transducer TonB n=1 Tax=Luteibacter sp. Sphag1AF TaxID=2587031 RepID=UPI0016132D6A|nr:energy transducer TonB [Luteibacter sp. Sphag1AF]MBB3226435.1 protein TonB [Luteibacter sp. Sphag1AF]
MRSTTALSLMALIVGIAGTTWLTALTYDRGPLARRAVGTLPSRPAMDVATAMRPIPRDEVATVDASVSQPRRVEPPAPALVPVYMPSPRYPMSALRAQREGKVVLSVTVTPHGDVSNVAVGRSSGDVELDRAAQQAVRTWRFAQVEHRFTSYTAELPVRFELTRGL